MTDFEMMVTENEDEEHEMPRYDTPGEIEFFVIQSYRGMASYGLPKWELEIEVEYTSGSAHWISEGMGVDYFLYSYFDVSEFKEGWTYTIGGITGVYIRGDGWTTDDDEEWDWETVTRSGSWLRWAKHKIHMLWWRYVYCPIAIKFNRRKG